MIEKQRITQQRQEIEDARKESEKVEQEQKVEQDKMAAEAVSLARDKERWAELDEAKRKDIQRRQKEYEEYLAGEEERQRKAAEAEQQRKEREHGDKLAAAVGEDDLGRVGGGEIGGGERGDGKDVEEGEIHQQVESHDEQDAADHGAG